MKYHITIANLIEDRIETCTKDVESVKFYLDLCNAMPGVFEIVSIVPAN